MFVLYAIPIGLLGGFLAGGNLEPLGAIRFRLWPIAIAALAIQLALFSPLANGLPLDLGRLAYIASTGAVVLVVLANLRLAGVPFVVAGAAANLVAILANGGAMPADPGALASLGMGVGGNTNSIVVADPALQPLTDVFALPAWLPFANVFSVGDVLIGIGIAVALAAGMRGRGADGVRSGDRPDGAP